LYFRGGLAGVSLTPTRKHKLPRILLAEFLTGGFAGVSLCSWFLACRPEGYPGSGTPSRILLALARIT
jgi:hypothetical protein